LSWPRFEHPELFWLALIYLPAWLLLLRRQRSALAEVERHVTPRFRRLLTSYTRRSLDSHLLFLLLLAGILTAAAAGPYTRTPAEAATAPPRLLLLIDASASMFASDVDEQLNALDQPDREGFAAGEAGGGDGTPEHRLDLARSLARQLVRGLDGAEFALASFSGKTTLHLPMTARREVVEEGLRTLEAHNYYRNTGSSLSGALAEVFHFADPRLQVVLVGDGELPRPDDYDSVMDDLAEQGIPVHGLTVGSIEGEARQIFDFGDIVAKVDQPRVLREYKTRRVDGHYRRIAAATGGRFEAAGPGSVSRLREAIVEHRPPAGRGDGAGRADDRRRGLSAHLVFAFVLAFLFESLSLGRRRGEPAPAFELGRLGRHAALLTLALALAQAGCSDSPSALEQAHQANERGLDLDAARRFEPARLEFERSIGFGVRAEIATYNLGRSLIRAHRFSEAHEILQRALELEPELIEAYFNDGIALYRLGREERDPRECDLERTRDLWRSARDRFRLTVERAAPDGGLATAGRANRRFMESELAAIAALIAEPPEHCRQQGAAGGGGGGGGSGGSGGGSAGQAGGGAGRGGGGGTGSQDAAPAPAAGLSRDEQETVAEALERIARQRSEVGKYHRRTVPEQFPRSAWAKPDPEIWW
jgi:tetratricopeptide (TPR) repeat protein